MGLFKYIGQISMLLLKGEYLNKWPVLLFC